MKNILVSVILLSTLAPSSPPKKHPVVIKPLGEIKEDQQLYQVQLAQTIAGLLGEEFDNERIAPAISLR